MIVTHVVEVFPANRNDAGAMCLSAVDGRMLRHCGSSSGQHKATQSFSSDDCRNPTLVSNSLCDSGADVAAVLVRVGCAVSCGVFAP
jgi:hypothetical protein